MDEDEELAQLHQRAIDDEHSLIIVSHHAVRTLCIHANKFAPRRICPSLINFATNPIIDRIHGVFGEGVTSLKHHGFVDKSMYASSDIDEVALHERRRTIFDEPNNTDRDTR